jgi:hypothetical protein
MAHWSHTVSHCDSPGQRLLRCGCNTRTVSRSRTLLALLIVLGLFAAIGPSLAVAGGGSAGDNQYVDPLAGVHAHGGSSSSTTSGTPATSPAPSSAPGATVAAATATTPTATTAGTTTTDPSGKSKTLPFTGFADWQAAGLGAALLAGGLLLRRRAAS